MATEYGVTATGFVRKRLADIKLEIEDTLRSRIGNSVNLLPPTVFAQVTGILAEREDLIWELLEDVYGSQYLASSTGVPLENVLALIGVTKLPKAKSIQRDLYLFGTPGTIIPVDTQVRVPGNLLATFKTQSSVMLVAGQDQIQRVRFADVGASGTYKLRYINEDTIALAYNASAADVAVALNNLSKLSGVTVTGNFNVLKYFDITFAGDDGKIDHPKLLVVENSVATVGSLPVNIAWFQNTQEAVAQGLTDAESLEFGPIPAPLYTLTEIVNPVAGLTRVLNVEDANLGRAEETDQAVKLRAKVAQAGIGRGTPDAIRARLLDISGVAKAIVFQNESDVVDSNNLPPHSIRAYVQGGDEQDIWDTIWLSKPAGIVSDGVEVGSTIDTQGQVQVVRFSRPEVVAVYIDITMDKDPHFWPVNGEGQVREALAGYVNSLDIGDDVIVYPRMISALNGVPGLIDLEIKVGDTSSPMTDDNIAVAIQEIARVIDPDTDITVVVNP